MLMLTSEMTGLRRHIWYRCQGHSYRVLRLVHEAACFRGYAGSDIQVGARMLACDSQVQQHTDTSHTLSADQANL